MAERQFDQEQYEMLLRCSEKKDMTEWNEWREANPKIDIFLEGANLKNGDLSEANLNKAHLQGIYLTNSKLWKTQFEEAKLLRAHLQNAALTRANFRKADLYGAILTDTPAWEVHFEEARLYHARLENADLNEANFENAELLGAHLENTHLQGAIFKRANLQDAHLEEAKLTEAHLENAKLIGAHLEKANFNGAYLQNANFSYAIIDGSTLITNVKIDKDTDFTGVGLDSMRIDPKIKILLEYNIRRKAWIEWYNGKSNKTVIKWLNQILKFPIRLFWMMNDYGRSTFRILLAFLMLAFYFAGVYYDESQSNPPGMINNLLTANQADTSITIADDEVYLRCIYFSVVTMTTLGFGDMHAQPGRKAGYYYLMIQVILGYVLLGALITRLSILFTSGGPSGSFSKVKKTKPQDNNDTKT